jgi:hypothetical protein
MFLPTEGLDKMRVVIADANQVVRTWLRTQLSQAGVKQVAMAGTASECCASVRPPRPTSCCATTISARSTTACARWKSCD